MEEIKQTNKAEEKNKDENDRRTRKNVERIRENRRKEDNTSNKEEGC